MWQEKLQALTTFKVSLQIWTDQILSQDTQVYRPKTTYFNETKIRMFHSIVLFYPVKVTEASSGFDFACLLITLKGVLC